MNLSSRTDDTLSLISSETTISLMPFTESSLASMLIPSSSSNSSAMSSPVEISAIAIDVRPSFMQRDAM